MTVITEGKLQLTFDPAWQVVQIDKTPWYRDGDAIGSKVKAMDVTAHGPGGHWWIEVKDCLGYEADNLPRLAVDPPIEVKAVQTWIDGQGLQPLVEAKRAKMFVADEVLQKVVGTIATLTAAARAPATDVRAVAVQSYAAAYAPTSPWKVVLLLTWGGPDYGRLASRLKTSLEQRLRTLNVSCFVINETASVPAQPWTVGRLP